MSTPRAIKQLERAVKHALLRGLGIVLGGFRRRAVPDWSSAPLRVLFIRHDGIGDVLMSTPLLRAIGRTRPNIAIDVLTFPGPAQALRGLPFIHAIHAFSPGRRLTYPRDVIARVRAERYDAIIDGTVRRFVDGREFGGRVKAAMVLLLLASRARHLIGQAGRDNDFVYTIPIHASNERAHHARYTASLGLPFGVEPSTMDTRPAIALTEAEREEGDRAWAATPANAPRLLVNISSLNDCRQWDDGAYSTVLRAIRRQRPDVHIAIIGGPGDETRATAMARGVGAIAMAPPLRVAFAAVASASLLLTPDTSMGHAAAALGTPVVVMLPTGHEALVPAGVDGIHLFGEGGQIRTIPAERVERAVLDMLARLAPLSPASCDRVTPPAVKRALKQVERAWKRVVFRAFGAMLPGRRAAHAPRWSDRPHRVLYLRYDRIGDMIMATPLIRALARSHPTVELDVLASPTNVVVLAGNPHVRRVIVFNRKRVASFVQTAVALRRGRYDAVIDGMVLQPSVTMLMLMLATGARYRIGIGGRANDFIYTHPVSAAPAEAHQILQSAMTLTPFGVDVEATSWRPELFIEARERERAEEVWRAVSGPRPRILVNIAAGEPRRRWPWQRVVAVIRAARDVRAWQHDSGDGASGGARRGRAHCARCRCASGRSRSA